MNKAIFGKDNNHCTQCAEPQPAIDPERTEELRAMVEMAARIFERTVPTSILERFADESVSIDSRTEWLYARCIEVAEDVMKLQKRWLRQNGMKKI